MNNDEWLTPLFTVQWDSMGVTSRTRFQRVSIKHVFNQLRNIAYTILIPCWKMRRFGETMKRSRRLAEDSYQYALDNRQDRKDRLSVRQTVRRVRRRGHKSQEYVIGRLIFSVTAGPCVTACTVRATFSVGAKRPQYKAPPNDTPSRQNTLFTFIKLF